MLVVDSLIRSEKDGSISFGNYTLAEKTKVSDFEHAGDSYKVKSFYEITKLEKNGLFVYESVPGSSVFDMSVSEGETSFKVTGKEDIQVTLELESEQDYEVIIGAESLGVMKTNLGGKLTFNVEAGEDLLTPVRIIRK